MDVNLLKKSLVDLHSTIYHKQAFSEFAPQKTDCLTSVHYIYKTAFATFFPITWIGDMPRTLAEREWNSFVVEKNDLQIGDLLFLKRRGLSRPIVHVALVLNENFVFHCTKDCGAVVESIDRLFKSFEQVELTKQLCYIDYRNKEKRKKEGGIYENGAYRNRTDRLNNAIVALYQMS